MPLALLSLSPPAGASPCAPVSELAFRAGLLELRTALELDRPATHAALVDGLLDDVPCLAFAVPERLWAELLVHVALRRFTAGGDWEGPLDAALRLYPSVDRGVGPGHPLFDHVPAGPAAEAGAPASSALLWWVDGSPALSIPGGGVHLVQATDGRWWGGAVTLGAPLPVEWVRDPISPPPHLAGWVRTGVVGGPSLSAQRATPLAADWFPTGARASASGAILAAGRVAAWSPVGLAVDGRAALAGDPWLEGRGCGAVALGRSFLGLGAGVARVGVHTGDAAVQWTWLPYPAATAGTARVGPRRTLELQLGGGGAAAVQSASAEVGWGPSGPGPAWRVVGRADGAAAWFVQPGTAVRVHEQAWTLAAGLAVSARSDP